MRIVSLLFFTLIPFFAQASYDTLIQAIENHDLKTFAQEWKKGTYSQEEAEWIARFAFMHYSKQSNTNTDSDANSILTKCEPYLGREGFLDCLKRGFGFIKNPSGARLPYIIYPLLMDKSPQAKLVQYILQEDWAAAKEELRALVEKKGSGHEIGLSASMRIAYSNFSFRSPEQALACRDFLESLTHKFLDAWFCPTLIFGPIRPGFAAIHPRITICNLVDVDDYFYQFELSLKDLLEALYIPGDSEGLSKVVRSLRLYDVLIHYCNAYASRVLALFYHTKKIKKHPIDPEEGSQIEETHGATPSRALTKTQTPLESTPQTPSGQMPSVPAQGDTNPENKATEDKPSPDQSQMEANTRPTNEHSSGSNDREYSHSDSDNEDANDSRSSNQNWSNSDSDDGDRGDTDPDDEDCDDSYSENESQSDNPSDSEDPDDKLPRNPDNTRPDDGDESYSESSEDEEKPTERPYRPGVINRNGVYYRQEVILNDASVRACLRGPKIDLGIRITLDDNNGTPHSLSLKELIESNIILASYIPTVRGFRNIFYWDAAQHLTGTFLSILKHQAYEKGASRFLPDFVFDEILKPIDQTKEEPLCIASKNKQTLWEAIWAAEKAPDQTN